jgi:PilZ domain
MAGPNGRSDERRMKQAEVELALPDASFKETAIAQNISTRGMRVATKHVWHPGERVLLRPQGSAIRFLARVVYCQRLENNRFAVGLEFLAPLGQ